MKTPREHLDDHRDSMPDAAYDSARAIAENYDGWQYGRNPRVSAAMAYYYGWMVSGERRRWTQTDVATLFDVSGQSMRSQWKDYLDSIEAADITDL